jgi:hypothetical protein
VVKNNTTFRLKMLKNSRTPLSEKITKDV